MLLTLPEVKDNLLPSEQEIQPSERVLVLAGLSSEFGEPTYCLGQYLHGIDRWQLDNRSGGWHVFEWWPLPELGSGIKPNNTLST